MEVNQISHLEFNSYSRSKVLKLWDERELMRPWVRKYSHSKR